MTQTKKLKTIPEFKSSEEEAVFWDTHDIREYDEFEPVELEVDKNLAHTLSIRLDAETLSKVRKEAQKKGIGATTLIRMWVREQVEELEKKQEGHNQYHATP